MFGPTLKPLEDLCNLCQSLNFNSVPELRLFCAYSKLSCASLLQGEGEFFFTDNNCTSCQLAKNVAKILSKNAPLHYSKLINYALKKIISVKGDSCCFEKNVP